MKKGAGWSVVVVAATAPLRLRNAFVVDWCVVVVMHSHT